MKKIVSFIFAALFTAGAFAEYETVGGVEYKYSVAEGKAMIGPGNWESAAIPASTSGALVIPSTLGGYPVTEIWGYAFYRLSSLTSITIPDSVTEIGLWSFAGCSSLTSITIPDSVTEIGLCAFWGCSSLTSITIPNSVTKIGECAFRGCESLTSIMIPDSVVEIGAGAFHGCSSLKLITISDSVTEIGEDAFEGCKSLHEVIVDSMDEIPRIKELMKNSKSTINVKNLEFIVKTNWMLVGCVGIAVLAVLVVVMLLFKRRKSQHNDIDNSEKIMPNKEEKMQGSEFDLDNENHPLAVHKKEVSPTPTLSKKFCTECGAKLDGKGKFCSECGTRL